MKSKKTPSKTKNKEIISEQSNETSVAEQHIQSNIQTELTEEINSLIKSRDEWKAKAQMYGERFAIALKGFLLHEGNPQFVAEHRAEQVLKDVDLIK